MANFFTRLFTSEAPTAQPEPVKPVRIRGAYLGAAHNRLNMDWNASLESADLEALRDLTALRGRSRDLCKNNPYAARFLELVTVNVIGPHGVSLQCRVRNAADELDPTINKTVETGFAKWGESATSDGKMTWVEVQQLAVRTVAMDGEVFIRMINGAPNRFGFALQIIDADYLDHTLNRQATTKLPAIRQGVEVDQFGVPLAYHFFTGHPSERGGTVKRVRIAAAEVVHLYRPTRPGQTRGIPWTSPAMYNLKLLGELMIAELVAARTGASKMGFIKTAADNASPYMDDAVMGSAIGETMDAAPGTIVRLDPGDEFQAWSPDHPSTAFDAFTKTILRGVAASLNVSYSALTYDLSSENYSSGRIGLLHERDYWRTVQQWMTRTLHQRVYAAWLAAALKNNALKLTNKNPAAYMDVEFRPRGFTWVDPAKEFTAHEKGIALGLTSRTKIVAEMGGDLREIFADLDRENQLAAEYGVNVGSSKAAPTPPPQPETPEPMQPDEEVQPEAEATGALESA